MAASNLQISFCSSNFKPSIHYVAIEGEDYTKIKAFVEALEARKLRIFHRELNFGYTDPCCMEFSLITLDWTNWNSVTKYALPPVK